MEKIPRFVGLIGLEVAFSIPSVNWILREISTLQTFISVVFDVFFAPFCIYVMECKDRIINFSIGLLLFCFLLIVWYFHTSYAAQTLLKGSLLSADHCNLCI